MTALLYLVINWRRGMGRSVDAAYKVHIYLLLLECLSRIIVMQIAGTNHTTVISLPPHSFHIVNHALIMYCYQDKN